MSAPALEFRGVSRVYPGSPPVHALSDVGLIIPTGAFSAIVGPSGSGKTTFLNLACGLDRPTSGEVLIAGQRVSSLSREEMCRFRAQHTGFVFQAFNLFPTLSAVENVEYTALMRGEEPSETRIRAKEALAAVGLSGKEDFRPGQLSGGQQQRVAIARALTTQPRIIFADEPTANLDSRTADELISLFEQLNRGRGVTFLFSTHDRVLMSRVKLRIELKDGKVLSVA